MWPLSKISDDLDAVILGMHAREDNPELRKAQELGIKIYSYPEFLFYHSRNKKRVVIGGSHGKTTITGMVMHVLKQMSRSFDYMVGSKLRDFDVMVKLSEDAPVMIFEGDEYLTSPIDRRPKFHWYKPHIALLSGIAWDHINVFPTFENYVDQFRIFIDLIEENGTLIYNIDDHDLEQLVKSTKRDDLKILEYSVPGFEIVDGITSLILDQKKIPLKVFGRHNLMNLNGARLICNSLNISDDEFYTAMSGFEGTANRLELVGQNGNNRLYKDFAHAPSKVIATIQAVREQFPEHKLIACLELHTFSSLSKEFLTGYLGSFDSTDAGCIYFNPHAISMKKLPALTTGDVKKAFGNEKLAIFADSVKMNDWLESQKGSNSVFLMMSSGNFNGINFVELAKKLI